MRRKVWKTSFKPTQHIETEVFEEHKRIVEIGARTESANEIENPIRCNFVAQSPPRWNAWKTESLLHKVFHCLAHFSTSFPVRSAGME